MPEYPLYVIMIDVLMIKVDCWIIWYMQTSEEFST